MTRCLYAFPPKSSSPELVLYDDENGTFIAGRRDMVLFDLHSLEEVQESLFSQDPELRGAALVILKYIEGCAETQLMEDWNNCK